MCEHSDYWELEIHREQGHQHVTCTLPGCEDVWIEELDDYDKQLDLLQRVRAERQRPGHSPEIDAAWEAWLFGPSGDLATQQRLERSLQT